MHTTRYVWIMLAALIGCGDSDADGAGGDGGGGGEAPTLEGRWLSDCIEVAQADGSTEYFQLDFDIRAARWELDYVAYADEACSVALLTVHIAGPWELEGSSTVVEGAWEARFGFDHKSIRPELDGARDFLDTLEGCGTAPFETGVANDVLQSGCPPFGLYPAASCPADFDLVHRQGDQLRFGARPADNDMCTPEARPVELSPIALQRQ